MKCDIRFDYIDMRRGEYWYTCKTCGAKDWYGRTTKAPTTFDDCKASDIEHCKSYEEHIELQKLSTNQLIEEIVHLRERLRGYEKN